MVRQPDAIFRLEECVTLLVHSQGGNAENGWFAMTLSDPMRRFNIPR